MFPTVDLKALSPLTTGGVQKTINLKALTAEAFGYSPLQRFTLPPPLGEPDPTTVVPPGPPAGTGAGLGLLGLPVFCKVVFMPVHGTAGGSAGLELLEPIITVAQPQNIVVTPITGRTGTVKEYIGQGDFAVTIRAILATDPHDENRFAYPLAQVQALRDMIALGVALPVSGWLLDVYGIKNLVVQNPTYESLPGFTNLQAIELQCLSDEPIELLL
jgi:hypothetical protein